MCTLIQPNEDLKAVSQKVETTQPKKLKDNLATRSKLLKKVETLWGVVEYVGAGAIAGVTTGILFGGLFLLFGMPFSDPFIIIFLGMACLGAALGLTALFILIACKHYEKKTQKLEKENTSIWKEYASRALKLLEKEKEKDIVTEEANKDIDEYKAFKNKLNEYKEQINKMDIAQINVCVGGGGIRRGDNSPYLPAVLNALNDIDDMIKCIDKEISQCEDILSNPPTFEKILEKEILYEDLADAIKDTQDETIKALCLKVKEDQKRMKDNLDNTRRVIELQCYNVIKNAKEILELDKLKKKDN